MAVTEDDEIAARVKRLRSHGMSTLIWDRHRGYAADYDVIEAAYNYRLDEVHGAIGLEQVKKLKEATGRRAEADKLMHEAIEIDGQEITFANHPSLSVHHLFAILLLLVVDCVRFREKITRQEIQNSVHYPLLHRFSVVRNSW
jgi:dTDP-4-amino-4,6-dideoxygalactose transaminase